MTCKDLSPLLASVGDGSLSPAEEKQARAHLEGCPSCRAAQERLEKLERLLGAGLAVPDPGDAYFRAQRERLLGAAARESVPSSPADLRRPGRARYAWAAAAAILILAAGAAYWRGVPARAPEPDPRSGRPAAFGKPPLPVVPTPPEAPPAARAEPESPKVPSPAPVITQRPLPEPSPVRPELPSPHPTPALPAPSALLPSPEAPKEAPPALGSGAAARLGAMTEEAVGIGLAETPRDRVVALFGAAEARLGELGQAMRQDPGLASELAGTYLLLLNEGVKSVLRDEKESAQELALARGAAREHARGHESTLVELGAIAQGTLKGTLEEALAMSRELARP